MKLKLTPSFALFSRSNYRKFPKISYPAPEAKGKTPCINARVLNGPNFHIWSRAKRNEIQLTDWDINENSTQPSQTWKFDPPKSLHHLLDSQSHPLHLHVITASYFYRRCCTFLCAFPFHLIYSYAALLTLAAKWQSSTTLSWNKWDLQKEGCAVLYSLTAQDNSETLQSRWQTRRAKQSHQILREKFYSHRSGIRVPLTTFRHRGST